MAHRRAPATKANPRLRQHERPEHFRNRWIVAGSIDEDPMSQRECEVVRYDTDDEGHDVVLVRFLERRDLFEPETATYTPWQLLPARLNTNEQTERCTPPTTS